MEDKTGIRWNDPNFPFRPLTRSTVLQYFEHSPFYDHDSNNREARARGLDPANDLVFRSLPMDRPEFVLAECEEPHLFVIRRQVRQSAAGGKPVVQAYYYVIGAEGYTFQAPSLHAVATARLRRCMQFVKQGFECFQTDLAPLPKILQEQQQAEAQQQQQQQQQQQAEQQQDGPSQPSSTAAPIPLPDVLTPAERRYWEASDGIIMQVLRKYPAPHLPTPAPPTPPAAVNQQPAQQQQQQQQQQTQQQQQQQQQPTGGAPPAPPAAAAAMPSGLAGAEPSTLQVPKQELAPKQRQQLLPPLGPTQQQPSQQQQQPPLGAPQPTRSTGSLNTGATGASKMEKVRISIKGKRQSSTEGAGGSGGQPQAQQPSAGDGGSQHPASKRQKN